jgi:hypothetical protein
LRRWLSPVRAICDRGLSARIALAAAWRRSVSLSGLPRRRRVRPARTTRAPRNARRAAGTSSIPAPLAGSRTRPCASATPLRAGHCSARSRARRPANRWRLLRAQRAPRQPVGLEMQRLPVGNKRHPRGTDGSPGWVGAAAVADQATGGDGRTKALSAWTRADSSIRVAFPGFRFGGAERDPGRGESSSSRTATRRPRGSRRAEAGSWIRIERGIPLVGRTTSRTAPCARPP